MSAKNKKKHEYKQLKLSDDYWCTSDEEQEEQEEQEKQEEQEEQEEQEKQEEQKKNQKKTNFLNILKINQKILAIFCLVVILILKNLVVWQKII